MPGHAPRCGTIVSGQNLIFIAVGNTPDDDTLQQALLKKLLENPELLETPANQEVEY